ncbi:amidase [Shinella sumterensis]|uniref:Indoleacetamide hydrolase n=1 Tax=Shinella sumterensis TaxID=1967501 RepID=A0AA50HBL0_9HYPH|nr:amidase [Shinella sumterensis]WLS01207.1 amidase [Shinella sumterensis]
MTSDPAELTAAELSRQISSGELSSAEAVDAFLSRIASLDGRLHAFVDVYGDEARKVAASADRAIRQGRAIGPWHGVPIALKDLIEIEGRITTGGSAEWRNRRSDRTATIARRLLNRGMIFLGKTQTVEFAMGGWGTNQHMGTPWNPWDQATARTPGGSSSGSGVAVAARMSPWAIGTDTGGSVRLPAAFCGITGLKVTSGRISSYGVMPLSPTLDTVGPMARTAEDTALLYSLLEGIDPLDRATWGTPRSDVLAGLKGGVEGLRLARIHRDEREGVDEEVLAAYDASLECLAKLGADIIGLPLPFRFNACFSPQDAITKAEAYALFGHLANDPTTALGDLVRERILSGRNLSAQDYLVAMCQREKLGQEMQAAMIDVDALLTPTTETPARTLHDLDESYAASRFTKFVNTFDMCALAVPNGYTRHGLPTSLQIVCKSFAEDLALRIGHAFQLVTGWHHKAPMVDTVRARST